MDHEEVIPNLPIYKAAMKDDWQSVAHIFDDDPQKLDAKVTSWWETPLQIAVGTNSSHRFVTKLINRIVETDVEKLRTKSWWGNTALHYAAKIGNTRDARLLVSKDPGITQITNTEGYTALKLAARYGKQDTLWYLLEVTKDEVGEDGTGPYTGVSGADLIALTLIEEGETWMKETSSSSTVVGALVVTMAFAAAFTAPGGNTNNGSPFFLGDGTFLLFIVSDAIALFSSTTSVLMFLAILTSRYAEEDFFYALPKRMMIALVSLFLSLAATMTAFSATLALVLRDQISWIAAPVTLMASVPVTLFAMLQFPLLVELIYSTYGQDIFHKENNVLLK